MTGQQRLVGHMPRYRWLCALCPATGAGGWWWLQHHHTRTHPREVTR